MTVVYPEAFWLLLPVFLLLLPAFLNYKKGRKTLQVLAGSWREESGRVYFIKTLTYWITIVFFFVFSILALAGITWSKESGKDETAGLDLILAVDISRSMTADDLVPHRLSRASDSASFILNRMPGVRTGLVIFKGRGETLVPLTEDRILLESALEDLSPGMYTVPGSDIEKGVMSALDAFPPGSPGKKAVVLISDGESLEGAPDRAAREAYLRDIPLYILGAGSDEGAVLSREDGEILKDSHGQPVVSRLDESVLRDMAELSGGQYFRLSDPRALGELTAALSDLTGGRKAEGIVYRDRFPYRMFLLTALCFLVLNLFIKRVKVVPMVLRNLLKRAALVPVLLFLSSCGVMEPGFSVLGGNYAYQQGRYQDALLHYLKAGEEDSHEGRIRYNIGNVYYALGESPSALEIWRSQIGDRDGDVQFFSSFNSGVIYYQMGRYPEAYGAFRTALELQPGDLDAKKNLELALERLEAESRSSESRDQAAHPEMSDDARRIMQYIRRKEGRVWKTEAGESGSANDW